MKFVAENYADSLSSADGGGDWFKDEVFLSRLGTDLRSCYSEVTDVDQPRHLMDLAETIDALIAERAAGE